MLPEEAVEILQDHGCIKQGHFRLRSGKCSGTKIIVEPLETDPGALMALARALATQWETTYPEVVVGAESGGILWGLCLAYQFECRASSRMKEPVRFVCALKTGGGLFRLDNANLVKGRCVILADDVLTYGGTLAKIRELVRAAGGTPEAAAVIWYRGGESIETLGLGPVHALISEQIPTLGDPCPLCADGIPFEW